MKRFHVISWICDSVTKHEFDTLEEVKKYIIDDQDYEPDFDENSMFRIGQYEILEVVAEYDPKKVIKYD